MDPWHDQSRTTDFSQSSMVTKVLVQPHVSGVTPGPGIDQGYEVTFAKTSYLRDPEGRKMDLRRDGKLQWLDIEV